MCICWIRLDVHVQILDTFIYKYIHLNIVDTFDIYLDALDTILTIVKIVYYWIQLNFFELSMYIYVNYYV